MKLLIHFGWISIVIGILLALLYYLPPIVAPELTFKYSPIWEQQYQACLNSNQLHPEEFWYKNGSQAIDFFIQKLQKETDPEAKEDLFQEALGHIHSHSEYAEAVLLDIALKINDEYDDSAIWMLMQIGDPCMDSLFKIHKSNNAIARNTLHGVLGEAFSTYENFAEHHAHLITNDLLALCHNLFIDRHHNTIQLLSWSYSDIILTIKENPHLFPAPPNIDPDKIIEYAIIFEQVKNTKTEEEFNDFAGTLFIYYPKHFIKFVNMKSRFILNEEFFDYAFNFNNNRFSEQKEKEMVDAVLEELNKLNHSE